MTSIYTLKTTFQTCYQTQTHLINKSPGQLQGNSVNHIGQLCGGELHNPNVEPPRGVQAGGPWDG